MTEFCMLQACSVGELRGQFDHLGVAELFWVRTLP
jgi:hypothetical protein